MQVKNKEKIADAVRIHAVQMFLASFIIFSAGMVFLKLFVDISWLISTAPLWCMAGQLAIWLAGMFFYAKNIKFSIPDRHSLPIVDRKKG